MKAIKINNFSKKYGSLQAINNINIEVEKGTIFGFVGKNGAGKSTTIRTMLNMIFPTAGTIEILGLDCVKDSEAIKSKISYLPSEINYYDSLKVEEILKFTCDFMKCNYQKAKELADYFELDVKRKISQLSLGNKKKVSIVLTLCRDSELYILDEPTNGLDPLMQQKFFDLIIKEKQKGKTVFLSSHNLSEVEKYCDVVAIIKDGKIVEQLTMSEVLKNHKKIITYTLKDNSKHRVEFDNNYQKLLTDLLKMDIIDLEIKNQSIEDDFINYYQRGDYE
ncbi:MAG: ABC transporter ATP-binding protein [Erysipelotrichaceae bacterium]